MAGDHVHDGRRVFDGARERSNLVQRGREGDQAIATDATVRWLESDDAAQRRGLTNRAAGIGAQGKRCELGADRGRRAAARAARHTIQVPRIAGGKKPEFSVDEPIANSSILLLPSRWRRFGEASGDGAVLGGDECSRIFEPAVVRMPR